MSTKCLLILVVIAMLTPLVGCQNKQSDFAVTPAVSGRPALVNIVDFVPDAPTEHYRANMAGWLKQQGLTEGKDFIFKSRSAQGDMATLLNVLDTIKSEGTDILVTFQPQTLYASIKRAPDIKIVFSIIASPFVVGAGKSDNDHLPNVTGFYYTPDYEKLFTFAKEYKPSIRRIGTIYLAGDDETQAIVNMTKQAASKKDIEIVAQGYSTQAEIVEAARSLLNKDIDAILINPNIYQNIITPPLAKVAADLKIPAITVLLDKVEKGTAVMAYGVNQDQAAKKFTEILGRVIKGENPSNMPFFNGRNLTYNLVVNKKKAQDIGLSIPDSLLKQADRIYE